MAERPIDKQNWYQRFVESYGPSFRVDVNNPQMGYGGEDIYRMYGITKDDKKFSVGTDQNCKLKLNSDVSIEICAGEEGQDKGEDISIISRRGNISLTACRNGTIKIKGSHIILDSDGDLDLQAANEVNINGSKINLNPKIGAEIQGLDGNLVPVEKQLLMRVFSGITIGGVGVDVLMTALGLNRQ